MARIPALVWLALGATVAIVSYRVGDAFKLFFYVGIAFLVVGIVKLFLGRKKQEHLAQHHAQVQHHTPHHAMLCPKCHYQIHSTDRFCKNCGHRLR